MWRENKQAKHYTIYEPIYINYAPTCINVKLGSLDTLYGIYFDSEHICSCMLLIMYFFVKNLVITREV